MQIIYRVVDLVFIADVFLNFNNGFYDKNSVLVMDHARIARRYINTWFVVRIHIASIDTKLYRWSWSNNELVNLQVDVISSVPVEMLYSNEDMDKAGFMRLNKVRNDNCAPVAQLELNRFGVSTSLISGGLSLNNYMVPSQLLRLFKLAKMFTVIRLGRIHRVFNRWEVSYCCTTLHATVHPIYPSSLRSHCQLFSADSTSAEIRGHRCHSPRCKQILHVI